MALNKSMHARNRYKDKPPDFASLASKYPEFKQHVQINLSGRVSVNFKDPEAVRALTCTLLKEDFGLQIDIPLERLIPTVPLRLNYIHWVEDLIAQQETAAKGSVIWGIDIGTGASCIYPLLGATLNGWYFIATEVDDVCFSYAKKNVEQNNLSDLIKVVKVPQKTLLLDALEEESEVIYDFCMCNPPFFANQLEAKVPKVTHTEFCQGRTMRWALAWSFYEDVTVLSPPSKKRKLGKPRKPFTFLVLASIAKELAVKAPSVGIDAVEEMAVVAAWIRKLLTDLKVHHKNLPFEKDEISLFLTARENSWIHLRRKKRDRVRQLRELPRASEDFLQATEEKSQENTTNATECTENKAETTEKSSAALDCDLESPEGDELNSAQDIKEEENSERLKENNKVEEPVRLESLGEYSDAKEDSGILDPALSTLELGETPSSSNEWFLFKCVLIVKKEGSDILVEMHWIEGQNRDLMNQLCTYLKNQIFRLVTI
ncbi:RNA N6-adenosine-methyltransferase METTL16 isoform X2 [Anolis sagrei]|uniref:RNA N6-adenosine-methyltransferase METTL16 isoform X2 n=1 Tax=Anolis sagrei TaxID=38937 RepID=UPI003521C428